MYTPSSLRDCALAALLLAPLLAGCPSGGEEEPAGKTAPERQKQERRKAGKATDQPQKEQQETTEKKTADEPAADRKKETEPHMEPVGREGLMKAIESHRGDVVLVDFWATWCPPCIEAFPNIITLHRQYEDLVVVSVNMDTGDDAVAEARSFLSEQDPPFPTYRLDVPEYSPFVRAMSDDWEGGLPAIFIYGRAGQRRHELLGRHGMDEIRSRAEPLLEEDPPGRKVPPPASREGN